MVDTNVLAQRISRAIDTPADHVQPIAHSILAAELGGSEELYEKDLKDQLHHSGIGDQWNHVLDERRAMYLAQNVRELLPEGNPVVLDILSGTGTVATALRKLGCEVIEADRLDHYPNLQPNGGVLDLDTEREKIADIEAEVVLVLVSLHHETDLNKFLGWLGTLKSKRFLVIENLRTPETDIELHRRMDWFFNRCLNDFGAECPGWYWDRKQWEILLGSLGKVQWRFTMSDVPGVPFAYDMFEITR